jgi:hypothetical protein
MLSHQSLATLGDGMPRLRRTDWTHIISAIASAIALYSASVLNCDTVFCFFAHLEIRLGPRNTAKPPVDLLLSEHPTQFASKKALTRVEEDFLMLRPMPIVCLRYRRILLTAVQWKLVGLCKYWQTLLTTNAMSGRVRVRY